MESFQRKVQEIIDECENDSNKLKLFQHMIKSMSENNMKCFYNDNKDQAVYEDGPVYLTDGVWLYPDGHMGEH